jgi:hypothetical protein
MPADIDVTRHGIRPNDPALATANTAALRRLLDPYADGPVGMLVFPSSGRGDIYHFNGMVQVRAGIHMDLRQCRLKFSKATRENADHTFGFFTFIRDVWIENGEIEVDYDGSGGPNAGPALRIGSRQGYPFAQYPRGVFDGDDLEERRLPPQGAVKLRNLRIITNNPSTVPILLMGGLRGVVLENVVVDGQGKPGTGILYEFGWTSSHGDAPEENWTSSHASGLEFRHVRVLNLDKSSVGGSGLELTGAYDSVVEDLFVDTANTAFIWRPGEALNYRPGKTDAARAKQGITLRNITGMNVVNGISLVGAESSRGGYLRKANLAAADQVDLMRFSLDGFALTGDGTQGSGLFVSGPCEIRNGLVMGFFNNLVLSDECVQFGFRNCHFIGSANYGVRGNFGDTLSERVRLKNGEFRDCVIAGSHEIGVSLGNTQKVQLSQCRFGHHPDFDGIQETTQTCSVALTDTASGVLVEACFAAIPAGATPAYRSQGSGDRGNSIARSRGTTTHSPGLWKFSR